MANNKVRIAVIGTGSLANSVHLPSLKEIPDADVVAVCDLVESRAKSTAEKFGIPKAYFSMYEMFEKEALDGAVVLTEPDRTFRAAFDCLKAGLNVMLEKPPGINQYQTKSLVRKAAETGKICAVAMNRRHIPLVQAVYKRMKEITEFTQVDGVFIKHTDISEVWPYADAFTCDIVHAVDLVRYFAQSEPVKAATVISRFNSPVDNAWSSVVSFANGVAGTVKSNYQTGGRVHCFEIHGPEASAFINLGFGEEACDAKIIHASKGQIYSLAAKGVGDMQVEYIDGIKLAGGDKFYQYYGFKQEHINFIECIKTGKAPLCTIADAAKTMEMVELLMSSAI